jgi:hypothetical protein
LSNNETVVTYASVISGLFIALLRCRRGHESNYTIPLTEHQGAVADILMKALLSQCEIKDIVLPFHNLSWSLAVVQEGDNTTEEWTHPALCYFAARGLRDDGNFIAPSVLGGLLAKFKYWCNTTALIQAFNTKDRFKDGMIG